MIIDPSHPAAMECVVYDKDLKKIEHVITWDDKLKKGTRGVLNNKGAWIYNESFSDLEAIILCHNIVLADVYDIPYGGPSKGIIKVIEL